MLFERHDTKKYKTLKSIQPKLVMNQGVEKKKLHHGELEKNDDPRSLTGIKTTPKGSYKNMQRIQRQKASKIVEKFLDEGDGSPERVDAAKNIKALRNKVRENPKSRASAIKVANKLSDQTKQSANAHLDKAAAWYKPDDHKKTDTHIKWALDTDRIHKAYGSARDNIKMIGKRKPKLEACSEIIESFLYEFRKKQRNDYKEFKKENPNYVPFHKKQHKGLVKKYSSGAFGEVGSESPKELTAKGRAKEKKEDINYNYKFVAKPKTMQEFLKSYTEDTMTGNIATVPLGFKMVNSLRDPQSIVDLGNRKKKKKDRYKQNQIAAVAGAATI